MSPAVPESTVQITVDLPDDLLAEAEREATRRGVTLSAFVAEALRRFLDDRAGIDRAIVEGYRRMPQDEPVDVDALVDLTDDLGEY